MVNVQVIVLLYVYIREPYRHTHTHTHTHTHMHVPYGGILCTQYTCISPTQGDSECFVLHAMHDPVHKHTTYLTYQPGMFVHMYSPLDIYIMVWDDG